MTRDLRARGRAPGRTGHFRRLAAVLAIAAIILGLTATEAAAFNVSPTDCSAGDGTSYVYWDGDAGWIDASYSYVYKFSTSPSYCNYEYHRVELWMYTGVWQVVGGQTTSGTAWTSWQKDCAMWYKCAYYGSYYGEGIFGPSPWVFEYYG